VVVVVVVVEEEEEEEEEAVSVSTRSYSGASVLLGMLVEV
jgi:hypothetical protein